MFEAAGRKDAYRGFHVERIVLLAVTLPTLPTVRYQDHHTVALKARLASDGGGSRYLRMLISVVADPKELRLRTSHPRELHRFRVEVVVGCG